MIEKLEALTIQGDAVRGSHNDRHGFMQLWHKFLNEHDMSKVTVYALYYNYANGTDEEFDFVLGTTVDLKPAHTILAGDYYVWDVGSNDPMDVLDAWWEIWQRTDIDRALGTDFELYVPGETIKIYLSIK